jgi:threonine dehydratase
MRCRASTRRSARAGAIAFSSGNHAQAVALSARLLGIPAVILMPLDAPQAKIDATRGYGAEVVLFDRFTAGPRTARARHGAQRGMTLIPPFDHPDVVAGPGHGGQGAVRGGRRAGRPVRLHGRRRAAQRLRAVRPRAVAGCRVIGVEPEAGNDGQQSFRSGSIVRIPRPTIADGAQTQALSPLTFGIIRRDVQDILTATDAQLVECMRFFAERMKLVVEPTGCLALAGALHGGLDLRGRRVGVVISGGNVDLQRYGRLLAEGV